MLAQLVINYGDATYNIPWEYIAYVVGSLTLPLGIIQGGKSVRRRLRNWQASKAERREHRRLMKERERGEIRRLEEQRREDERRRVEASEAEKLRKIKASLPGIWWQTYEAMKQIESKKQRAETLEAMIRGSRDGKAKIDPKNDPLPPEGMKHLSALIQSTNWDGVESEASKTRMCMIDFYLPVYVAAWIEKQNKIVAELDKVDWGKMLANSKIDWDKQPNPNLDEYFIPNTFPDKRDDYLSSMIKSKV